ncbi:PREDICTED: glutaredoxin-3 [Papilio polytes]|uniref:glutaredoxin-3 n=1 Tax=Papilio polytes TaxID=76194 RepID=UPI000675D011|nr:PREDICTED: glutaredoxin-3 [Papilio polytes]
MSVINLQTVDDFVSFIGSPQLTVVHFSTDWAEQCPQITAVLEELSALPEIKSSGSKFGACDAEGLSEISLKYKVDSVPTVILFKNGSQLDRVDGADVSQITSKVKAQSLGKSAPATTAKAPLKERLESLINRHKVMIFMKGDRQKPRCGFSRTLIEIMNETGVPYDTFDILTDEEVRQGLKEYSDWPTYPQLYVKGELVGGLDIIKEMKANGELESTLKE